MSDPAPKLLPSAGIRLAVAALVTAGRVPNPGDLNPDGVVEEAYSYADELMRQSGIDFDLLDQAAS